MNIYDDEHKSGLVPGLGPTFDPQWGLRWLKFLITNANSIRFLCRPFAQGRHDHR